MYTVYIDKYNIYIYVCLNIGACHPFIYRKSGKMFPPFPPETVPVKKSYSQLPGTVLPQTTKIAPLQVNPSDTFPSNNSNLQNWMFKSYAARDAKSLKPFQKHSNF